MRRICLKFSFNLIMLVRTQNLRYNRRRSTCATPPDRVNDHIARKAAGKKPHQAIHLGLNIPSSATEQDLSIILTSI